MVLKYKKFSTRKTIKQKPWGNWQNIFACKYSSPFVYPPPPLPYQDIRKRSALVGNGVDSHAALERHSVRGHNWQPWHDNKPAINRIGPVRFCWRHVVRQVVRWFGQELRGGGGQNEGHLWNKQQSPKSTLLANITRGLRTKNKAQRFCSTASGVKQNFGEDSSVKVLIANRIIWNYKNTKDAKTELGGGG